MVFRDSRTPDAVPRASTLVPRATGIWIVLQALLLAVPALAAEKDYTSLGLDELTQVRVVYGASRYEQPSSEAPSAVTVITRRQIEDHGYVTLAEALAGVRGFYVTDDRNYQYSGVRGFNRPGDYNSRVLILVDGHRQNDELVGQGSVGREAPVDLAMVDRIEVIRGPGSALHGSDAVFAVVNVVTRSAAPGFTASGTVGTPRSAAGHFAYGTPEGRRIGVSTSGQWFGSRGEDLSFSEFRSPGDPMGVYANGDGELGGRGALKLEFGGTTLHSAFSQRRKGIPTASFGTLFGDTRARTWDTRVTIELQTRRALGTRAEWLGRGSFDHFDYHGDYPYAQAGTPEPVLNSDRQRAQWAGAEVRITTQPWHGHRAVVGTEVRRSLNAQQKVWDRDPDVVYMDDRHGASGWAAYAQDEWRIQPWVSVNAGGRFDDNGDQGRALSPRAALLFAPHPRSALKLLWGEAFRAPTMYEMYYDGGGYNQKANPDLTRERMRTLEGVIEQQLTDAMHGSLSVYQYEVLDLISQVTDPADSLDVFRNADRIHANGVEGELTAELRPGTTTRWSYAHALARDRSSGAQLTNSPRHIASAHLRFPLPRRSGVGAVEALYRSERATLSGGRVPAAMVVNLTLSRLVLSARWLGEITVRNAFDSVTFDPGGSEHLQDRLPGRRRELRASISIAR